jgi:hypothetical protein
MARIKYEEKRFSPQVRTTIDQANAIIEEYNAEGLTLTLRQLYYQFVSRDLIPNRQDQYRRLSRVISDGRLAGLIDWFAIVDRTRNLMALRHYADPGEAINFMLRSFILDRREAQPYRPEVWIEKKRWLVSSLRYATNWTCHTLLARGTRVNRRCGGPGKDSIGILTVGSAR